MPLYKRYQRILDFVSYALISATFIANGLRSGEFFSRVHDIFTPGNIAYVLYANSQSTFLFIFLLHLLLLVAIFWINKSVIGIYDSVKTKRLRKALVVIITASIASLLVIFYTYSVFYTAGGFIVSGRPGITGGLSNFLTDFLAYALLALICFGFLALKNKLHKRFNTSVILFLLAIAYLGLFMYPLPSSGWHVYIKNF